MLTAMASLKIYPRNLTKLSLWQLSYSYLLLLSDIHTMSQGRTATKNKHLPPDHLSSNSLSVTKGDVFFLAPWLALVGVWPAPKILREEKYVTDDHVPTTCAIVCAPNTQQTHCLSLDRKPQKQKKNAFDAYVVILLDHSRVDDMHNTPKWV